MNSTTGAINQDSLLRMMARACAIVVTPQDVVTWTWTKDGWALATNRQVRFFQIERTDPVDAIDCAMFEIDEEFDAAAQQILSLMLTPENA